MKHCVACRASMCSPTAAVSTATRRPCRHSARPTRWSSWSARPREDIVGLRDRLETLDLTSTQLRAGIVVVDSGPHRHGEVAGAFGLPVIGTLDWDPRTAEAICESRRPPHASKLMRSAAKVAADLAAQLPAPAPAVDPRAGLRLYRPPSNRAAIDGGAVAGVGAHADTTAAGVSLEHRRRRWRSHDEHERACRTAAGRPVRGDSRGPPVGRHRRNSRLHGREKVSEQLCRPARRTGRAGLPPAESPRRGAAGRRAHRRRAAIAGPPPAGPGPDATRRGTRAGHRPGGLGSAVRDGTPPALPGTPRRQEHPRPRGPAGVARTPRRHLRARRPHRRQPRRADRMGQRPGPAHRALRATFRPRPLPDQPATTGRVPAVRHRLGDRRAAPVRPPPPFHRRRPRRPGPELADGPSAARRRWSGPVCA